MDSDEKGKIGEDFVNHIAYGSFLHYWCYPGLLDITGDNKEICDLLVLFNKVCIIISVKNYDFKDNYERYFKKTTEKAISQINGAERKLFGNRPILLKHPDRQPLLFPKDDITEVYRIIVNLNTTVKYFQTSYFENGKNYTIMDAEAWSGSMTELNTLPDMVAYIRARCSFFSEHLTFIFPRAEHDFNATAAISSFGQMASFADQGKKLIIILGSELDLVAHYILSGFQFPNQIMEEEFRSYIFQLDGRYLTYQKSDLAELKTNYERESYFIDELVRELMLDVDNGYLLAELLLNLNRLDRGDFARFFLEYHDKYTWGDPNIKMNCSHAVFPNLHMVFLYYTDDQPRDEIDELLKCRLMHHHYLHNFNCREVGALGMSQLEHRFVFGYSRLEEYPSPEELSDMEVLFRDMGWKLNS
jgi:hypothetical protein